VVCSVCYVYGVATKLIRACPACQATNSRSRGQVNGFAIQACETCDTLFTATLPQPDDVTDYAVYYDDEQTVAIPDFVLERLRENVRALDSYRQAGSWLDLGCGAGTLLRAAEAEGWRAVGTEIVPTIVDALRASGLDVRLGETSELDLHDGSFDVVSLIEVMEHVTDPTAILAEAARLVRPGGAVYITTPHGRGVAGRILKTRWSAVAPPEHLQLFSVQGMRIALQSAGLKVRSASTHGINPHELAAAIRADRTPRPPGINVAARYRLNEALSTRRSGSLVKRAVNGALSAMRVGDNLKIVAERVGG
jgi:SAM-dependent methyltransferase